MPRPPVRRAAAQVALAALSALILVVALPGATTHILDRGSSGGGATAPAASPMPAAASAALPSAAPAGSAGPWGPSGQPSAAPQPVPSGDSAGSTPPRQVLVDVPIPVLTHGPRAERVIALTFDDGWGATATAQIFAVLESAHVAATFFPYAAAVRKAPALWRSIAAAGYPIANHTTNHPDLTTLPAWRVRAELDVARTTIEAITGHPLLDVFRPPYGAWNATVLREAAAAGMHAAVLWDVDTRDWTGIPASVIAARAEVGTAGSIVLLHAGPPQTPLALPAIIAWYRAHDYGFVTLPQLLARELAAQSSASRAPPSATPTPIASSATRASSRAE